MSHRLLSGYRGRTRNDTLSDEYLAEFQRFSNSEEGGPETRGGVRLLSKRLEGNIVTGYRPIETGNAKVAVLWTRGAFILPAKGMMDSMVGSGVQAKVGDAVEFSMPDSSKYWCNIILLI